MSKKTEEIARAAYGDSLTEDDYQALGRTLHKNQDIYIPTSIICFAGTLEILGAGTPDWTLMTALYCFAIGLPLNALLAFQAKIEESERNPLFDNILMTWVTWSSALVGLTFVFLHFSFVHGCLFVVSTAFAAFHYGKRVRENAKGLDLVLEKLKKIKENQSPPSSATS